MPKSTSPRTGDALVVPGRALMGQMDGFHDAKLAVLTQRGFSSSVLSIRSERTADGCGPRAPASRPLRPVAWKPERGCLRLVTDGPNTLIMRHIFSDMAILSCLEQHMPTHIAREGVRGGTSSSRFPGPDVRRL